MNLQERARRAAATAGASIAALHLISLGDLTQQRVWNMVTLAHCSDRRLDRVGTPRVRLRLRSIQLRLEGTGSWWLRSVGLGESLPFDLFECQVQRPLDEDREVSARVRVMGQRAQAIELLFERAASIQLDAIAGFRKRLDWNWRGRGAARAPRCVRSVQRLPAEWALHHCADSQPVPPLDPL